MKWRKELETQIIQMK